MRSPLFAVLLCIGSVFGYAAETPPTTKLQIGKFSTVQLLATARGVDKEAPDGVRFLFLIKRAGETTGQFALKETRDFLVAGESYQTKTQTELGKVFEPGTSIDAAEKYFAKQPGARKLAPEDINGAYVLSVAITGAKLATGESVEVTVHVGFGKEIEPFSLRAKVPPTRSSAPKSQD